MIAVAPVAAALPSGSGAQQPTEPTVRIGDYCGSTYSPSTRTARTADGRLVYCVQVSHTDAFVWWPTPQTIPVDPHNAVSPGHPCLDEGARWSDPNGREILCEKTRNGRAAGNLVWMFAV
ncbi:hypothetical protein [Nocardia noduli]|uniref:hypothetical protein n=1 Tax=Nocardia noduli TaxID=2815722 RepID=UPI001C2509FD|nr:hypothetical protein [Nocardia noduli]